MKKSNSVTSKSRFFILKICVVVLLPFVHSQRTNWDPVSNRDPFEQRGFGGQHPAWWSSIPSEHQVSPDVSLQSRRSNHLQGDVRSSDGMPISLRSVVGHRRSKRNSISRPFLESGETARVDFSSRPSFRRETFQPASEVLGGISPDFDLLQPVHRKSVNGGLKNIQDFVESPYGAQDIDEERNYHLQTGQISSDMEEQLPRRPHMQEEMQSRHRDMQEAMESRNPHMQEDMQEEMLSRHPFGESRVKNTHFVSHLPRSEENGVQSHAPDPDDLEARGIRRQSGHSSFAGQANMDSYISKHLEHQPSTSDDHYKNMQRTLRSSQRSLDSSNSPDESDQFRSIGGTRHKRIRYPDPPLKNEHLKANHEELDPHSQPYELDHSASTFERDDRPFLNQEFFPGFKGRSFPEDPTFSEDQNPEHRDTQQESKVDYPPLDICSEETHEFYDGAISSSSPVYDIEAFLPRNFSNIFRKELLDRFRQYDHPDIGERFSVCDHRLKFGDEHHSNVRSLCPFHWEVTSYNSARYPPYLMSAQCSCQRSKSLYQQWSFCEEKKGRLPVLWRVGCNEGRHVYMEGWDEINVACVPTGPLLQPPGEAAIQNSQFEEPPS